MFSRNYVPNYPLSLCDFDRFLSVTVLNPNSYNVFCPLILRAHKGMYLRSWFLSFLTPQRTAVELGWQQVSLKACQKSCTTVVCPDH